MYLVNDIDNNKTSDNYESSASNTKDDQVLFLYLQLLDTPLDSPERISVIEQSIYQEIHKNPNDTLAAITFLQTQIMTGNNAKAKAIAYKIWDSGRHLKKMEEYIYINQLLDVGLLDMASQLLKSRFLDLRSNINYYYLLLLKFSTMTGNCNLLERLIQHPDAPYHDTAYLNLLRSYQDCNYNEHFKNIQRIVFSCVKDSMCFYDYQIQQEAEPKLISQIYVMDNDISIRQLHDNISEQLEQYYTSVQLPFLSIYKVQILPVTQHQILGNK